MKIFQFVMDGTASILLGMSLGVYYIGGNPLWLLLFGACFSHMAHLIARVGGKQ